MGIGPGRSIGHLNNTSPFSRASNMMTSGHLWPSELQPKSQRPLSAIFPLRRKTIGMELRPRLLQQVQEVVDLPGWHLQCWHRDSVVALPLARFWPPVAGLLCQLPSPCFLVADPPTSAAARFLPLPRSPPRLPQPLFRAVCSWPGASPPGRGAFGCH